MANVFVACKPKPGGGFGITYDITPVLEYGEPKFLFDAYDQPSTDPQAAYQSVWNKLKAEFNESTDYVVWAGGDPFALLIIGMAFSDLGIRPKYLKFQKMGKAAVGGPPSKGYYIPVQTPEGQYE